MVLSKGDVAGHGKSTIRCRSRRRADRRLCLQSRGSVADKPRRQAPIEGTPPDIIVRGAGETDRHSGALGRVFGTMTPFGRPVVERSAAHVRKRLPVDRTPTRMERLWRRAGEISFLAGGERAGLGRRA